jgi:short-subunit dehydrogenase
MSLVGKSFVITGGSSGIGRATALLLARNNASIFITGTNEKRLFEVAKYSKNIVPIVADLSKPESTDIVADTVASDVSEISGFVHSAGEIYTEPFETFRVNELIEMEEVNVNAGFEILKKLMPIFNRGSIVFVSSIDAFFGAVNPPSTLKTDPWHKLESSEAKKKIAPATSSAVPILPIGIVFLNISCASALSGIRSVHLSIIPV